MTQLNPITKCQISLVVAIVTVSLAAIFIRLSTSPAAVIAFWRLFLSVMLLIPFLGKKEIRNQFNPYFNTKYLGLFMISGFFLSLHFLSWIQSLKYSPIAISVIVVNSAPLWVFVLSILIMNEKASRYQVIGLILGFVGLVFIALATDSRQFSGTFHEGLFLALIGAVMYAIYIIIGRRMRTAHMVPNIPFVLFMNLFCAIFLLIFAIAIGVNVFSFPINELFIFAALAIGPTLLGHALLMYALKHISAQTVSLSAIGEAVGASLFGLLLLGEEIPYTTVIGGFLILMGIYLSIRFEITNEQKPETQKDD
jgi:drug/metabolite transporter (DMT)-like permease